LKRAGLATVATTLPGRAAGAGVAETTSKPVSVAIVRADPDDSIASAAPAQWAAEQLRQALAGRQVQVRLCGQASEADRRDLCVVYAGRRSRRAGQAALPDAAEALSIEPGVLDGRRALFARGHDVRGLVYALTELADVAALASDPVAALGSLPAVSERPANAIRSCMRIFCSDVEDKGWFGDRGFWKRYLSMLVAQRFNRFNLSFGIGYDFTREIRDAYLHFSYPFLLEVPGYDVRATHLKDAERDANLETLRFISDEAAARGLHFQLGLWTHAYEWTDSPEANHTILGLTPQTHGPYCRDALALLLKECPNIAGVTLRTHGESGVAEGTYDFWKMVFEGAARAGRRVEIDLHAKGLDQRLIDMAVATGLPVTISPKFWAEHMGLPYHQAGIRPTELPSQERGPGLFANSSGARSFLRYGYGDLLAEDRRHGILHRIWPGTQRLLLWGDPGFAAAYGRASGFCGSRGCEVMEPLSFKGRKGSGQSGRRTAYADESLATRDDFEKHLYTYRLWGRLLYNPDAHPDTWQRFLLQQHGAAAPAVEAALADASRILPLVTTAHTPSAANNHWWPEMYVNMSIVDATHPEPFTDTPAPKRFGAVSPLDPQLFSRIDDLADSLIKGEADARYSPLEVGAWLTALASSAAAHLVEAHAKAPDRTGPAFRRFAVDTAVLIDLGRFYAHKLRAAVLYALFERTGDERTRARAVDSYREARQAWVRIAEETRGVYVEDVTFGIAWYQRGHWADRLAAIDADIAAMQQKTAAGGSGDARDQDRYDRLLASTTDRPVRSATVRHTPPPHFRRAQPLSIGVVVPDASLAVTLRYRRVDQAEPWQAVPMKRGSSRHTAVIPAAYTDSVFPLQYYFELRGGSPPGARLYPGFDAGWSSQPYVVVRQSARP
jgi:hypothetical protein